MPSSLRGELGQAQGAGHLLGDECHLKAGVPEDQSRYASFGGDPLGDQLYFASEVLHRCWIPERAGWPRRGIFPRAILCFALLHEQEVVVSFPTSCPFACVGLLFFIGARSGGPAMAGGQTAQAETVLVCQLESVLRVHFMEKPAILEAVKSSCA
jgi:hypothetical protein